MRRTELARTEFKRTMPIEPKPPKGPRQRKCSNCGTSFLQDRMGQQVCGYECAQSFARRIREQQERKADRVRKQKDKARLIELKPVKWHKAKAKKAMHAYVRAIAVGQPCCSCDTILLKLGRMGGDYDAGHLRSVGSASHLEFDPRNIWGQCKDCNMRLHGNEREYERRLRIKMGDEYVDGLLADNAPRHYKAHDYQTIEAEYKAKLKSLKESA
jgi:hypothetical protein